MLLSLRSGLFKLDDDGVLARCMGWKLGLWIMLARDMREDGRLEVRFWVRLSTCVYTKTNALTQEPDCCMTTLDEPHCNRAYGGKTCPAGDIC